MFTEAQASAYKSALVRFYQGTKVIGAGLYCSRGSILTCAHIATQSLNLGKKPQEIAVEAMAGKRLKVDFPFRAPGQFQEADVVPSLWRFNNEDLAVLKIEASPDDVMPLALPKSTYYRDNRYHVCGFPDGHPHGLWAQGVFLDQQAQDWVQIEDTKAQGIAIEPGFSGAPVWDEQLGGLAGITVARDQERDEAKVGFMIPYQKLKPVLEAIALFDLLLPEADKLAPHWQKAYRFVRPEISRESYPSTLEAAILQVQNTTAQGSGYRAIEQFMGYLSLPECGLSLQPQLWQWLQDEGVDVNALLEAVRQKQREQQAQQPTVLAPHLLFWVQAEWNSDRYSVQAYLVPNREAYNPTHYAGVKKLQDQDALNSQSELEALLQVCIDQSVEALPQEEGTLPALQVEIFLPRQSLRWQVDQWRVEQKTPFNPKPKAVGARYSVVLRCADRLEKRFCGAQMQTLWRKKWHTLERLEGNPASQHLTNGNHEDVGTLCDALDPEPVLGWQRLQPPPSVAEDEACHFSVLLGTGACVTIWLRQALPNGEHAFSQLLQSRLAELPAQVFALRKNAQSRSDKSKPHIGEHLSLVWDDPKLVLPGAMQPTRLRMPA